MKNIILTYLALFLAFSLSGQKYVQEFTKTDGTSIAISLSDLAFAIPSGTNNGSVLILGPNAKTIYVTDSLQGIVDSSSAMLVLLEESYKLNGKDAVRDVAISKQQVKEVVPSGASQTFLKLASPQKTILINDDYATVAAALSAASGGGGGGNGIYGGSGSVTDTTFVNVEGDSILLMGNFTGAGNLNIVPGFEFYYGLENLPTTQTKGIVTNDQYNTDYYFINGLGDPMSLAKNNIKFTGIKLGTSELYGVEDSVFSYFAYEGDTSYAGVYATNKFRIITKSTNIPPRKPKTLAISEFSQDGFETKVMDSLTVAQQTGQYVGTKYYTQSGLTINSSGLTYGRTSDLASSGLVNRTASIDAGSTLMRMGVNSDTLTSVGSTETRGMYIRFKYPGVSYPSSHIPTALAAFIVQAGSNTTPIFTVQGDVTMNGIKFYNKYNFPNQQPSVTSGARSYITWTGTGSAASPAMTRTNWANATGTTDGSGDLTITHNMPDATFAVATAVVGTTSYTTSVHTKGATEFKIRFYNPTTGAAVTATAVAVDWIANDN